LLDTIRKKIIASGAQFEFAIKFAQALRKSSVSSSGLAGFESELEERKNTIASRKSSLDSARSRGDSDSSEEPRRASTGDIHVGHRETQISGRRRGVSESSSSAISDDPSSRRSSTGSDSSLSHRRGSASSDSGIDPSSGASPSHVSNIRRQLSTGLQPINESEVNTDIPEKFEDDAFQGTSTAPEEYIETKEAENFLPSPEMCSDSNPTREEMPMRQQSKQGYDRFIDTVLKAAQEFCREDREAASKEYHEMDRLYLQRISELEHDVSTLHHSLQESEQHIKDAEHEKTLDIQEKENEIVQREEQLADNERRMREEQKEREEQLAEKEREMHRMREEQKEMHAKIKRTENEVDRLRNQLSGRFGRKKLEILKELVDLLENADDAKGIKTAINLKINTLKFDERPNTSHM
jgi:DNA repair exonuclease SbcCD ATPase subunit